MDASALVAMLAREEDAPEIADRLDEDDDLIWSPMSRWETATALSRLRQYDVSAAASDVNSFGQTYHIRGVDIGDHEFELAVRAARLYGRRSGHPANLNMGDCFAYACAKTNQARLLYKGNDFAQTDLA